MEMNSKKSLYLLTKTQTFFQNKKKTIPVQCKSYPFVISVWTPTCIYAVLIVKWQSIKSTHAYTHSTHTQTQTQLNKSINIHSLLSIHFIPFHPNSNHIKLFDKFL